MMKTKYCCFVCRKELTLEDFVEQKAIFIADIGPYEFVTLCSEHYERFKNEEAA